MLAGLTEHAFLDELGIGDPPLVDYISAMLSRFINMDEMYQLHDLQGRRLEEVADMMMEAEALPTQGRTRREIYRHIGDFTLFWTGVYPEAVKRAYAVLSARIISSITASKANARITLPALSTTSSSATKPRS